jgi:preprotein translocase subunit SecG
MYQFILVIHIFVAVSLIALVLVQQGKGATIGAAFGSGASQTVFGSRGSGSFLLRITFGFLLLFFVTSISLNYMASRAFKDDRQIVLPTLPVSEKPASVKAAVTPSSIPTSTPAEPAQSSGVKK